MAYFADGTTAARIHRKESRNPQDFPMREWLPRPPDVRDGSHLRSQRSRGRLSLERVRHLHEQLAGKPLELVVLGELAVIAVPDEQH